MPVSGVVIKCRPEFSSNIAARLTAAGRVEVHHMLEDGALVAIIESATVEGEVAVVEELLRESGVLDVQIAYHNFEDLTCPD
ncbi:MAG: chaperone NapD [Dehalococcoidia bacterium]